MKKFLEVFGEYLEEDECCEVVNTSRGYTVMIWDTRQEGWNSSEIASSPEKLRDMLLDSCDEYLTCKIFDECKRESPTKQEKQKIEAVCRDLRERCGAL